MLGIKIKSIRLIYIHDNIEKSIEFDGDELIYEEDGSIIIPPPENNDLAE